MGRGDGDIVDDEFGRLLESLAACEVERVGHHDADGVGRGAVAGENVFAADDGVTDGRDEIVVDLELFGFGDERVVGKARDELRGVVGPELEFWIQHALDEGGGVFGDLLKQREVRFLELAVGAGGRLFVEHLDGADDDVAGLQRHGEHGAHVEAGGLRHRKHHGSLRLGVPEEDGFSLGYDFADDAFPCGEFKFEEFGTGFFELGGFRFIFAPECR